MASKLKTIYLHLCASYYLIVGVVFIASIAMCIYAYNKLRGMELHAAQAEAPVQLEAERPRPHLDVTEKSDPDGN